MNNNTKNFAFVLGREKELAYAELISVLEHFCFVRKNADDVFRISGNVAFAKMDIPEDRTDDFKKAITSMAGTIKVFRITNNESRITEIVNLIKQSRNNDLKFNFGISDYSGKNSVSQLNRLGIDIKILLKKDGYKTRFVASKDAGDLSSILSLKNDLVERGIEIGLFDDCIGKLIYLNNPEEWNERDYGKPKGDKFSGMLPPKLARMMVNLAMGQVVANCHLPIPNKLPFTNSQLGLNDKMTNEKINENWKMENEKYDNVVVVDPFCGSGNVLMEAMMLGYDVVGSDISPKAVADTKANLEWLAKEITNNKFQITNKSQITNHNLSDRQAGKAPNNQLTIPKYYVCEADALTLDFGYFIGNCNLEIGNYDNIVIVTEPYLGRPKKYKPTLREAQSEYAEIKKLYIKFLENLSALGPRPSALCIVFPLVETAEGGRFSLFDECVDEIKKMGYTQSRKSMVYGREYQIIKREIVFLNLKFKNLNV